MATIYQNYENDYSITGLSRADIEIIANGYAPDNVKKLAKIELYGISLDACDYDIMMVYLRHGKMIPAIKHVRSVTGAYLKQAKEFVDEAKAVLARESESPSPIWEPQDD